MALTSDKLYQHNPGLASDKVYIFSPRQLVIHTRLETNIYNTSPSINYCFPDVTVKLSLESSIIPMCLCPGLRMFMPYPGLALDPLKTDEWMEYQHNPGLASDKVYIFSPRQLVIHTRLETNIYNTSPSINYCFPDVTVKLSLESSIIPMCLCPGLRMFMPCPGLALDPLKTDECMDNSTFFSWEKIV